ncbi:MAG TPA: type IV toxin-antitoxin system AbiEi family antitoxin domain-containing protein [Baekduia sp.]|nr:type IV toxin-antitoxin system AbiEi family antitoxin domain-containing protein [Baekduia sp.]
MPRQRTHDRVISAAAGRTHGVVSRASLLAAGVPRTLIDDRVRSRRLVVLHRGVYALGHAQLRPEGWWYAAVAAYGDHAALSHGSAAALWDIWDAPLLPVHVSLAGRTAARRRRGVRPRRAPDLVPDELVEVKGIRVTTVARTILDLAAVVRGRRLEQVVRRAARHRAFDLRDQRAVLDRHPRRRGAPELGRLLAALDGRGTDDFRSRMEIAFAQLCDDYGLPRPVVNGLVLGERVDFQWPGTTLLVETDGFEFHAMPTTFGEDRRRDQKLTLAGYTVIRLGYDQVVGDPGATAATVSALLSQCRVR